MASVKLEDCSQALELNVIIKYEEEEKIGTSVSHGDHVETFSTSREQQQEDHRVKRSHHCPHYRLRLSLRPLTSTVRTNPACHAPSTLSTNPACHSPSTLSTNLQSLGPDCDSGTQFALQDPEMASVKLEDCSQTLELNVNIKDEEEVSHGKKFVVHSNFPLCIKSCSRPVS
ncbi:uncharacterized protein LOC135568508 isoform X2 [Oncorhynchus nerka]|uniref:uncharacterized protein LOC135568508 isoform X2 n=1 Tax=Oncorhynchus nerka TaxID=8023 RepID=UPI0031B82C5A